VFFKLYTDQGWQYPPPLDVGKDDGGAGVGALGIREISHRKTIVEAATDIANGSAGTVSGKDVRKAIKEIDASTTTGPSTDSTSNTMEVVDEFGITNEDQDEDFVPQISSGVAQSTADSSLPTFKSISASYNSGGASSAKLFSGLVFWLSRETPRNLLEFVIKSFGGKVGWPATMGSGSPFNEDEASITHVVVDRPAVAGQPHYVSATTASSTGTTVLLGWLYGSCHLKLILISKS
jgi:pescadillo protein